MKSKAILTVAVLALSACAQNQPPPADTGKQTTSTPPPGSAIVSHASFNYVVRTADPKSSEIAPIRVWSDGRFTYMTFTGGSRVPSIYIANGTSDELVNWRYMPGYAEPVAVIEAVADSYHLRLGDALVEVDKTRT